VAPRGRALRGGDAPPVGRATRQTWAVVGDDRARLHGGAQVDRNVVRPLHDRQLIAPRVRDRATEAVGDAVQALLRAGRGASMFAASTVSWIARRMSTRPSR
jgi:hypothetical protein